MTGNPPDDSTTPEDSMEWSPAACSLPVAERPLRVAEFDGLFAAALRQMARPKPRLLRLWLDGSDEVAATTGDLVARESACCSFFEFTLDRTSDRMLLLEVRVLAEHVAVLDGLEARAASAAVGWSA